MEDDWLEEAKRLAAERPRIPGVNWSMALAVSILRTLEKEQPGFMEKTKDTVLRSAASMESSGDQRMVEDAPSMHELAESWVFMPPASAD